MTLPTQLLLFIGIALAHFVATDNGGTRIHCQVYGHAGDSGDSFDRLPE